MAQTIEEFVISLGLKVDKAAEQRFTSALGGLGKTFAVLAAGLTATAGTIQAAVIAVSKSFDNLYFAAQRTNSTVAGIKSLSYAFSQIGGTADEAMGAISGLAKAMRTNPGMIPWLNGQGIKTAGKDVKQILMDAADVFAKKDYHISNQFAEMIGIPEETWNKWVKNKDQIRKFEEEQEATQRRFGVDPKKAAESSNELMTKFRSLTMELGVLFEKITVALQPQLNQLMADIAKWFEEHQEQVVKVLGQILEAVKGLITDSVALLKALQPVADKFAEMVRLLTGDKDSLKVALELLAGGVLLAFIAQWGVLLATLAGNPAFWALVALVGAPSVAYLALTQASTPSAIGAAQNEIDMWTGGGTGQTGTKSGFPRNLIKRARGLFKGRRGEEDAKTPPQAGVQGAKADGVNAELKRRYDKMLADAPEEVRNAIKVNSGYRSIARQEQLYREALAKYGPAEARKWVAPPGKSNHNYGEAMDLGFGSPEARAWVHAHAKEYGLTFPMDNEPWHVERAEKRGRNPTWEDDATRLKEKHSELFGAPALGSSSARSASISNRTSITVYGSSDPAGTAANLSGAQSRVASELIRNGQSAFV